MKNLTKHQLSQEEEYIFPYHYDDIRTDSFYDIDYISILRTIKKTISPFNGQKLLDAGCGDGRFCYELKNENINITGVDYSERALAFARAFNPSIEFQQEDLSELPFEKEFDVISLVEVLEHIPLDKIKKVRDGLWRAIKDDGRIILSVPSTNEPLSAKHYQHFTKETLVECLGSKFELVKILGHSKSGRYKRRYLRLHKLCKLAWLFRNIIPKIKWIIDYRKKYYEKHLEFCEPHEACRLMAEFKKKK